jgi:hypothetical protein
MGIRTAQLVVALMVACVVGARAEAPDPTLAAVNFNRDVRPILSDACFHCHGPDKSRRKGDLRLDVEADARAVIVAGNLGESEVHRRITSRDEDERMPPPDSGRSLTPGQVETIRRWILQGAPWAAHWSLVPPTRPTLPPVRDPSWARNAIDDFVLARLDRDGLSPGPEAGRTNLIRRVSLDLTGLPPTPEEVDAFLSDSSPDAYAKIVDRLLASPRYGERMAVRWLDAARYADTSGYQTDGERFMWRWRDWVIDAYNANMPFDRFTVEQIAGDMLPGATLDQVIATGFNRNHRGNSEGGIIPEEYAVEYVVDRVETTATVWLGLTAGCARCHDHKYDPITQKDFYGLYAFFNNVPEKGRALKTGNSPPYVMAPTSVQRAELDRIDGEIAATERTLRGMEPEIARLQRGWEASLPSEPPIRWASGRGLKSHFRLDGDLGDAATKGRLATASGTAPGFTAGPDDRAVTLDGRGFIDAGDVGDFGFLDRFSIGAWVRPEGPGGGAIVSRSTNASTPLGYLFSIEDGKVKIGLYKRPLDDAIRVESRRRLEPGSWHHVLFTYDGSRLAAGVVLYVDGSREPLTVLLDDLNQTFQVKEPLRIGAGGGGTQGHFSGAIDDVRVYNVALGNEEVETIAVARPVNEIAGLAPEERSRAEARKLRMYYLEHEAPVAVRQAREALLALKTSKQRLLDRVPTTMVMREMDKPRETFVLVRGQYDKPGERVDATVPSSLPPLPRDARKDRLALARWLVDPGHPLTSRVAVNRLWQMLFGTGLVKTADDFGSQGEWPSHPDLLDWLATEYGRIGWDTKALLKTMVMSATYRQSSKVSPESLRRDPENRLLARGPRIRLSAEAIRDQALAISGLLVEERGGPSVKPYQPEGLWTDLSETPYVRDNGASLHRRSLYTFWKRTIAPPSMMTFDASGRETCSVRETRTNTPLQALTLMNDVTFVEASRVLAERVLAEGDAKPDARLTRAFRLATSRPPVAGELEILRAGLEEHLAYYQAHPDAAETLARAGEAARRKGLDPREVAAYTAVAGLLLNLDETITKE